MGSEFAQTFLRKDDPKVLALLQQAELLSSLAIKVKAEKTDQSLENAWMVSSFGTVQLDNDEPPGSITRYKNRIYTHFQDMIYE